MELVVRLVGPFAVVRGGRVLPDAQVGSRKARTLLALLAAERRIVTVDRIVAVLWPGRPPQRPADNVATLVSRVRSALGQELVEGGRGGYRLADGRHRRPARGRPARARRPGPPRDRTRRRAGGGRPAEAVLAAAPALTAEPTADWAAAVRSDQAGELRRARQAVAAAALAAGLPARARDAADAALRADPFDEDAARALMRAHDALGEPARALAVYERLRAVLAEELGVDPSPATRDLHVAVLRGGAQPAVAARPRADLAGRGVQTGELLRAWQDAAGAGRQWCC